MENYYFINSVDPENQMMRIQEVGAGEMSAPPPPTGTYHERGCRCLFLMLDEATQEGEPLIVQLDLK